MKTIVLLAAACLVNSATIAAEPATPIQDRVDFRYAPPEWQTAICLPDDAHKSLVDKSGELLYGFGGGGREFATRIGIEVDAAAVWQRQELQSPRVPMVRTIRQTPGLEIVEEAFAVTGMKPAPVVELRRTDGGEMASDWVRPPAGTDPSLRSIALHNEGGLRYEATVPKGGSYRVALALCEGWWSEAGHRIQSLQVEGAEPKTVDTVANIGKNQAAAFWFDAKDANGDGKIEIAIDPQGTDKNTILNGLWIFAANTKSDTPALLAGKLNGTALARRDVTGAGGPPRNDLILVRVTNTGREARTLQPRLTVDTTQPFSFSADARQAKIDKHAVVTASLKMAGIVEETGPRRHIQLESLTVPAGQSATFFVLCSDGGSIVLEPATVEAAQVCRDQAIAYWETQAPLPFGRFQVPDAGIQAIFDSSVRNIWQAREIKNGHIAFQVGPTCYRGLWIVDGAFLLESAAMLGAGQEARDGVAYEMTFQKPDGRIQVMGNFSKENGIVLWTCVRHAQLTQDKAWLETLWPKLERVAQHIKSLRQETLKTPGTLNAGLMPSGFIDGGLSGSTSLPEYSQTHWNLAGLKAFVQAARWLGKTEQADLWQKEYDDFLATFEKAAKRDLAKDARGNAYVPIVMGEAGKKELPQRAQWTFCHAVYPGQLFAKDDPLVAGTMAMLAATEREGLVYGTGWDAAGIWNYFASFYAHAWLWNGNGPKAAEILYAFGNHAAPTLVWREEQSLKGEPFRKVGDMPHNWASAEFIRLAIHLLALDRGDELHLLEGLPAAWTKPGMVTKLNGIATPFGALSMELKVAADGKSARLHVEPLADASCRKIIVHLGNWNGAAKPAVLELDPKQPHDQTIPIEQAKK
jgi:hypothetical protein